MKKAKAARRPRKAEIYASHGVQYDAKTQKILAPVFGWIKPLLINGNEKLGKGVYTFSTLAGSREYTCNINGVKWTERGTCSGNCAGCYAQAGRYVFESVVRCNLVKTYLSRHYPDFVKSAILAQLEADRVELCRIHASGEFIDAAYISIWHDIAESAPDTLFWSYTKNPAAENAFSDLSNINIVKSIIPGFGFNYGKCEYILRVYAALTAAGEQVYICRCGVDPSQHCTNCAGCAKNKYVLFLEHGTGYNAAADPLYSKVKEIIDAQAQALRVAA